LFVVQLRRMYVRKGKYVNTVMELFDTKKQTLIDTYSKIYTFVHTILNYYNIHIHGTHGRHPFRPDTRFDQSHFSRF